MKFEPDTAGFEMVILNVIDLMLESITTIPRVESKLFASEETSTRKHKSTLKAVIDPNFVKDVKDNLRDFIYKQMRAPENHLKILDKYDFLVNLECDKDIEKFIGTEPGFDKMIAKVGEYKEYNEALQHKFARVVQCEMFELHLDDVLRKLAKR